MMDDGFLPIDGLEEMIEDKPSTKAEKVLMKAWKNQRLPHATLLYGKDLLAQETVALSLAKKILRPRTEVQVHPDFHLLRPSNKMRQISVQKVRELNKNIHHSANQGGAKVIVIYEPDRMNKEAANAFLKTLEEPPEETYIFLLTARPYNLLDTIRSRCFRMQIPSINERKVSDDWHRWMKDFSAWISSLQRQETLRDTSKPIMHMYGLLSRSESILAQEISLQWKIEKENLPDNLEPEQLIGLESGLAKAIKQDWFTNIEEELFSAMGPSQETNWETTLSLPLSQSTEYLEKASGLMGVNLKESQALEYFFLQCLRIWPRYASS